MWKKFVDWLSEIFTDALGRPEIKIIIGVPALVAGLIVGLLMLLGKVPSEWAGWSIYMAFASGLLVTTAVADAKIDKEH